ncbi:bifunctional pyr operon transcriptional regulator/uracil phosphoribosyltransferase PyrR [bacterium]|nr:bifunctional pyr operon transcriptional regulator/uracil phosphoribosyltransferase PyrR [bacterium]
MGKIRTEDGRKIMDKTQIRGAVRKMAGQIVSDFSSVEGLVIIGIRTRGADLTNRLVEEIEALSGHRVQIGFIDTTFYRDDVLTSGPKPVMKRTDIPFNLSGKRVILMDDVLYTGRTIRAALDALMDLGRPACVKLAVLIDRGHRELPIQPDYVGKVLDTSESESVQVRLEEEKEGGPDRVLILPYPERVTW